MVSCIDFSVSRELPSSSVSEPDSGRTTAVLASPKKYNNKCKSGIFSQIYLTCYEEKVKYQEL